MKYLVLIFTAITLSLMQAVADEKTEQDRADGRNGTSLTTGY